MDSLKREKILISVKKGVIVEDLHSAHLVQVNCVMTQEVSYRQESDSSLNAAITHTDAPWRII